MKMIEKLERMIRQRGLSQAAVERSLALSANRISKWKDGQGEPTARQAWRLARFLGVNVEFLVNDDLDEPPPPLQLTQAEAAVLTAYRASGLDEIEAVRALIERARTKEPRVEINPRDRLRAVDDAGGAGVSGPQRQGQVG